MQLQQLFNHSILVQKRFTLRSQIEVLVRLLISFGRVQLSNLNYFPKFQTCCCFQPLGEQGCKNILLNLSGPCRGMFIRGGGYVYLLLPYHPGGTFIREATFVWNPSEHEKLTFYLTLIQHKH